MNRQPNSDNSRQDALRAAQKQITRSLLLALAALGVIVIACYAWFVRNTTVSGALGSISAESSTFELASVGTAGAFDGIISDESNVTGESWEYNGDAGTITSGTKESILWRIDQSSSHLGNDSNSTGIEPGSSGTLQFYVVPKRPGDLELTFTIEIIPLAVASENNEFTPITDDAATNFLKGHLLLHYQVKNGQETLLDPANASFDLTLNGLTSDSEPVLINLKWHWPFLLEDAVSDSAVKQIIAQKPEFFFHDGNAPLTEAVTLPGTNDPEFRRYSNYYNNADQYIGTGVNGTGVDAVLFRLTAEER